MARPKQLGPYRIQSPLGKGGMGHVYAAEHVETGGTVAVKALSPELAVADGFRERFRAEVDSLRLLRHENIVELYGYGEQDGVLFYAMELVDGSSLEEELRAGRRFNWREVTHLAVQVCRALKHAHDHGVIHRDIKPANILVDRTEHVKLADFGIARLFSGTQLTMAGGVVGTADYMSPEQAASQPINDRCDQYSLGCVMYTLLAGRPPFRAAGLPQMLQLQRYAKPEPVSRFAPQTPAQLESVLTQLLDKSPEARFPNALVLARHLEAMLHALTKPGRDDFQIGEPITPPDLDAAARGGGTPIEMAITQVDASAEPSAGGADSGSGVSLAAVPGTPAGESAPGPEADSPAGESVIRAPSYTAISTEPPAARPAERLSAIGLASVLFVVAAAVIGGGYAALRPATADELFADLKAIPDRAWASGDEAAVAKLRQFDRRFPDDARQAELDPRRRQIDMARLESRLKLASRGTKDLAGLTAAERLYLQAWRRASEDPAAAAEQMGRLAELLCDSRPDSDRAEGTLAALANHQAQRLQTVAEEEADAGKRLLGESLGRARRLAETDAAKARSVCRALIALYGDRRWAADGLADARRLLQSLPTVEDSQAQAGSP